MIWQDIIIMVVSIVFSIALVPQVWYGFKNKIGPIAYQTSVPTFIGLYVMAFTFLTLSLYLSTIITLVTGTLWLLLFVQRVLYHKPAQQKTAVAPPSPDST